MQKLYIKLYKNFESYLTMLSQGKDGEDCFEDLYLIAETLLLLSKCDPACFEGKTSKLLLYIFKQQSYLNYFKLRTIIKNVGSPEDKERLEDYENKFRIYIQNRLSDCPIELCNEVDGHFTVIFVVNTMEKPILKDCYDFLEGIAELFDIPQNTILLRVAQQGSLVIGLQFSQAFISELMFTSLHHNRFVTLKNVENVRTLKFEDHELFLENWQVLEKVEIGEESIIHEQDSVVRYAHFNGETCMALEYSSTPSIKDQPCMALKSSKEVGYVKYLEGLLNSNCNPDMPAIKGIYYPQPAEEYQYPLLITEKYDTMEKSIIEHVEEVEQVSFILDIASCINNFKKFSKSAKITVHQKSIFVCKENGTLRAKLCPLYGYSYVSEQMLQPSQAVSLPLEELSWMRKIAEFLDFNDHKLAETHLLKKMFDQKWLSEEDSFRPSSFKILCDDLQNLLETERIWLGLVAFKPEDAEEDEVQIHFILIGHTGVGKTSVRKHLKNEPIDMNESPTIVMEPEFLYREAVELESGHPFKHIKDSSDVSNKKVFLTMWDTGGQPIFQDLLPCFARLNCMYGIVFRLTDIDDFDSKPTIRPCDEYHEETSSPFTKKDIFYRNLAFVQAFSCSMQDKIKDLPMMHVPDPSPEMSSSGINCPAAVVVGTCKDEVSSHSTQTQDDKEKLYEEIKDFIHRNNMSIYYGQQHGSDYILEVDNTVSGKKLDPGIDCLRKNIHQCARDSRVQIVPEWQRFKLALQRLCYNDDKYVNQGIMPLSEAVKIGEHYGVSSPKSALKYFHELGVFMWYHLSKNRTMNSFVVIDQRTLLDVLSKVFCFNIASVPELKPRLRKGILPIKFFQQLLRAKASKINDDWFTSFLEEHHLSIKINLSGQETGYFIPSILSTTPDYENKLHNLLQARAGANASDISPLYIVPQSGYIPTGMFTRLLTALAGVTYGSTVWRISLEDGFLDEICRNQFEFIVNDKTYVILSEFSKYIKVDAIPFEDEINDILFHIVTTLDVQVQRIVPQWMKSRQFTFTFSCDSCGGDQLHFLENVDVPIQFNTAVKCDRNKTSFLERRQIVWHGSKSSSNRGETEEQFRKSLKNGSLNISVASIMFIGMQNSLISNAEQIIFQEVVSSQLSALVDHKIYFRAEPNPAFQKIQHSRYDDIVFYSMSSSAVKTKTSVPISPKQQPAQPEFQSEKQDLPSAESKTKVDSSAAAVHSPTTHEVRSSIEESQTTVQHQQTSSATETSDTSPPLSKSQQVDQSMFLLKPASVEHFMQYGTRVKMELCHVYKFNSDFCVSEIFKVFIKNVSLCSLVTDLSENLSKEELTLLRENENFASRGIVIGASSGGELSSETDNAVLSDLSNFLLTASNQPRNFVFSINDETGANIADHAVSSATSTVFPSLWYYFGFKLRQIMESNNLHSLSISKQCMIVAKQLNMDMPNATAALEHLAENNVLLYFGDILEDTVFSGVYIFSHIFSKVLSSRKNMQSAIINGEQLSKATQWFTNHHISSEDFIVMFTKLMIMAPYGASGSHTDYILPSQLALLVETERKSICSSAIDRGLETLFIQCLSSGYEYVSMLTVFLLTVPSPSWKIQMDSTNQFPLCLKKNCVKFLVKDCAVTISFFMKCIEVYVKSPNKSPQDFDLLSTTILQGLEKIKLNLNVFRHQAFDFSLSFRCVCSSAVGMHLSTFDPQSGHLLCNKDKSVTTLPNSSHMKWLLKLGTQNIQENLSVNSIMLYLSKSFDQWIKIAGILCLPDYVIDSILVSRLKDDEASLRKVIEWWFKSTPNPEWNAIRRILDKDQDKISGLDSAEQGITEPQVPPPQVPTALTTGAAALTTAAEDNSTIEEEKAKYEIEMIRASKQGDVSAVQRLLELGANPDAKEKDEVSGWSVLMCAAKYGHLNILELLLEFGAEIDAQDKAGYTALHIATRAGQYDAAELLQEKGADPNIYDNVCGMSPLMTAVDRNDLPIAKMLYQKSNLNAVSHEGKTAFIIAIEKKFPEMIDLFLKAEDFTERISVDLQDVEGRTAIHAAVENGNLEIVKHLISLFPQTRDIEDKDGNKPADLALELGNQEIVALLSPEDVPEQDTGRLLRKRSPVVNFFRNFRLKDIRLMRAAKSGDHTAAEKLLKKGADPNTKEVDYLLWTPLMWAGYRGHTETVKVLLKYRADPNIRATNGYTALILASGRGHHEVVAALVDPTNPIKADLNIRNSVRGWSALMWASQTGKLSRQSASEEAKENRRKVVKHLLAAGADVNLETRNGWTPLMQASQDGDAQLVKILCEAEGVDLDHESESTWTALTTACRKKSEDIVKVLVEHGATVDKKKKGGVTAMHIASYYNLQEATRSLVEVGRGDVNIQDEWGMTALILAAKQDHRDLIRYLVVEAKAGVNIQAAEKYAAWSALFFAVKNGDKKIVDFLLENGGDPYLLDKHQHNSITYSKGLFLGKKVKMYKHLVTKLGLEGKSKDTTPTPQEGAIPKSRESVDRQDFTPANAAVYTSIDLAWRTVQLPNLIFN